MNYSVACTYIGSHRPLKNIVIYYWMSVGRDISVDIAIRYRLDGPGIESRWGPRLFRTCPDRCGGPPSLPYNGYRVSFPRVKRPGRGVDHPHLSRVEVKDGVALYLYSPEKGLTMTYWKSKHVALYRISLIYLHVLGFCFLNRAFR
jgi:hypothetical protein